MNENEQLSHLNSQPLNQHAKKLLLQAKQQPDPSRLHLFQLAEWGLDQPSPQVENPERLRNLVGVLYARSPESQQEFLLSADPSLPQEHDRLTKDLPKLNNPVEASNLLLQVLNLHAGARIPYWDKT